MAEGRELRIVLRRQLEPLFSLLQQQVVVLSSKCYDGVEGGKGNSGTHWEWPLHRLRYIAPRYIVSTLPLVRMSMQARNPRSFTDGRRQFICTSLGVAGGLALPLGFTG